jgi:hypothetical protein
MEEKSLQERVREYDESREFSEYRHYWCDSVYHFFYDGYLFWTNEDWIDARLKACDYVSLYKYIIRKLEIELRDKNLTDEDRKYLMDRLNDNKQMFYKELSSMIRDYCIGG